MTRTAYHRILLLAALLAALGGSIPARVADASQWGSPYGDPFGFCAEQSRLPASYGVVVTNDPSVPTNPERDTFWGWHPEPGYDDWYGYWYGDFRGRPGDDSGWTRLMTVQYGSTGHWNFSDFGWAVHGHAKQYTPLDIRLHGVSGSALVKSRICSMPCGGQSRPAVKRLLPKTRTG